MNCPNGLHFNRAKNVCDNPEEANCTARNIWNRPGRPFEGAEEEEQ